MFANYWEPQNLWEAISLLSRQNGAVPMAGGTDLLVKIKKGQIKAPELVNLKRLVELKELAFNGQTLNIGALTRVSALLENSEVNRHFPVLALAARGLGTPQIRNTATIGGNLCNSSPAADLSVALLAYEARLKTIGPDGARLVPVHEFFSAPGRNVLKPGEVLVGVEIDVPPLHSGGTFIKHGRRKSHEIALVNIAVMLAWEPGKKKISAARIALGAVAPIPMRVRDAEDFLVNAQPGENGWKEAGSLVMKAISPIDDVRSSAAYRRQIAGVLTRRALAEAWGESL
ncbi:MAG TPA: xanthine dehydrogenase family protein subunit M [Verrucomicrobiae bacterium]|nr:xanthine dehydrogenase family protein subunit M [Verrucomicrobiae bacterium]